MKVKLFNIGLNPEKLIADQGQLNAFLEGIKFVKSDTHFVESEANYWSVLIHYEEKVETKTAEQIQESDLTSDQLYILKHLKQWRTDKATELSLSGYMICHNSELINIAVKKPNNTEELKRIKGFGDKKTEKHGDDIISVLNAL